MYRSYFFKSFFMAGFECSSHKRDDGRRLDLIAATAHDRHAESDYRAVSQHGLLTARDGLRWHLIEPRPRQYDWSSFLPMLQAARRSGTQVIWDLCHYGWPDDIDIWHPMFIDRFARFCGAAAKLVRDESDEVPCYSPVNEISYWAWASADNAQFHPMGRRRGSELKRQLVRAAMAGIEAVRAVDQRARFVQVDPVIHVAPQRPEEAGIAEAMRLGQYEAWDMLTGRMAPELGGKPEYLDIVGVNYYSNNQWLHGGPTIELSDARYRPFADVLTEVHQRYGRPILIAETGAEGDARQPWLRYVCDQAAEMLQRGLPIEGLCVYPVLDYPGWSNDRHCPAGLYGNADEQGVRELYAPLASELERQRARFGQPDISASLSLSSAA